MFPSEKEGDISLIEYKFKDLNNYCGLLDLGYSGLAYTWSNRRQAQFLIHERLDKTAIGDLDTLMHQSHIYQPSTVIII